MAYGGDQPSESTDTTSTRPTPSMETSCLSNRTSTGECLTDLRHDGILRELLAERERGELSDASSQTRALSKPERLIRHKDGADEEWDQALISGA